jgi:hypothetical protein
MTMVLRSRSAGAIVIFAHAVHARIQEQLRARGRVDRAPHRHSRARENPEAAAADEPWALRGFVVGRGERREEHGAQLADDSLLFVLVVAVQVPRDEIGDFFVPDAVASG